MIAPFCGGAYAAFLFFGCEIMGGQPVRYTFSGIANTSNVRLDSFYWRDTIPAQVRLDTVVTGTQCTPSLERW